MRSEKVMFDLILDVAKKDTRVRAVYMNGSRVNKKVVKDVYQDYDIVYIVEDLPSFISNLSWIDVFGERYMLQMPETMREPSNAGHFNWMMLFTDGNRLDLTLIPSDRKDLIGNDSLSIALLDKDNYLTSLTEASDKDYVVTPPSELFYQSCCNNFWWCLQNVAKGIARDELPYVMMMYHDVVRAELHDMISWYIALNSDDKVPSGKLGKYFKKYLPKELYEIYCKTFSDSNYDNVWKAIEHACTLFHMLAIQVGESMQYRYHADDEKNMKIYIENVKHRVYERKEKEVM